MKKITKILTFALLLAISLYACDTKKDPAPVVPPAPVGFTAAQVAGVWKLTSGSASVAGGAINVPDIFDPAGASAGSAEGREAFCNKNAVLTLKADGTFTEDFQTATYTFSGNPPTTCTARTATGTFAIPASSSNLTRTYAGGTPAPSTIKVKSVSATALVFEISSVNSGSPVVTTLN